MTEIILNWRNRKTSRCAVSPACRISVGTAWERKGNYLPSSSQRDGLNLGRSFTACNHTNEIAVPAGRLNLKVSRPAGTEMTSVYVQAVNDLPTVKRPAGTKMAERLQKSMNGRVQQFGRTAYSG